MLELHRLLDEYRDAEKKLGAIPVFDDAAYCLGKYKDGALLRFRGVVYDVQDPELVLLAPGAADQDADQGNEVMSNRFADAQVGKDLVERVPLKVALFPHRTEWAMSAYESGMPKAHAAAVDGDEAAQAAASTGKGMKRSNEAVGEDVDMSTGTEKASAKASVAAVAASSDDALVKKSKAADSNGSSEDNDASSAPSPFLQNLINVYVYGGQYKDVALDAFKVNEAFDFIGVLDLMVLGSAKSSNATADATQMLTADELQRMQISDVFDEIQQRQRSGVVVHCCDATAISVFHHVRPHRPCHFYTKLQQSNVERKRFCSSEWSKLVSDGSESKPTGLNSIRQQLIGHLALSLDGDLLAAEYLLLCLLSRVYTRSDVTTPLGNLSLNLTLGNTLTADQVNMKVDRIETAVRALVPVCTTVDLGLQNLNESKFIPHKDYDTDAMYSGALQVPHGTVMLVKETSLSAGQLNDQGVKNISALHSLVDKMLLPYDFQYYSMDFPQDVAVVSVSEGKSILPVTVSIPLVSTSTSAATATTESPLLVEAFRVFIGVLRTLEVSIGNEQAEIAEKHYVACRQAKQEVSLEDLHRWLRIARLMALSHGEEVVSKTAWDRMLELENQRNDRVQA